MPNHASITILGHLGKDPVLETKGEYGICRFSVAVTRKRKAGDLTTWWNVTAWRKEAEYAGKYLKKGDAVFVQGEPYLDEYTGDDGAKRQSLKIEATRVSSLAARLARAHEADDVAAAAAPKPIDADEPPF